MFGNNKSVVNSAPISHAKLHKRYMAFSFHTVREVIDAGIMSYRFLPGKDNPSDMISKHWGYHQW